ncbi:MAG: hypothetical protein ACXWQO_18090 [Bdellovibrionota bacterium]
MKLTILAVMAILTGSVANAADSARLACDNGHILLHVFEHRNGADSRATDIVVVYGGYVFAGEIEEGLASVLAPLGAPRNGNQFSGVFTIDYSKNKVKVANGELNLEGERLPVDAKFNCKELN